MDGIWSFEGVNLYHILCPSKLKQSAKKHADCFNKGDVIYMEEDSASKVFLIHKGKVKIVQYSAAGDEVVRAILGKGEVFGVKAILGETQRNDYAIAATNNTKLCSISINGMYDLMRRNERFSLVIYKIIGFRIKRLERRLDQLFFKDAKGRLLEFIDDLRKEQSRPVYEHIEIMHHFTHKDIADLIGTKRETVTRLLNELKQQGILDHQRRKITIENPKQFKALVLGG